MAGWIDGSRRPGGWGNQAGSGVLFQIAFAGPGVSNPLIPNALLQAGIFFDSQNFIN